MQDLSFKKIMARFSTSFVLAATIAALAGCSDNTSSSGSGTTSTASAAVASIQISGSPTTVKSDNSNTSTIVLAAVSASNAAVPGATIAISTDTGLLNAQTLTTDSMGRATAYFSSGIANKTNRTATITAISGTTTALLQIQITGSTLAMSATGTSLLSSGASPATLTITAKDASGTPISGAAVTLTQAGSGTVNLTPATGMTDANGQLAVSVAGATAGTVVVTASAAGATATFNFLVSATTTTFGINQLTLTPPGTVTVPASPKTAAMKIGDSLAVQVSAPASAKVTFATTIGTWLESGTSICTTGTPPCTATLAAGVATATLNTTVAGVASVQVLDPASSALSDSLSVEITASTAARIDLQASPTVLPRSVGTTVGLSNLTATVYDATGAPVGGAPVAFSIVAGTGTGSGETVSPVVVFTSTTTANGLPLGAALTTFTSGSLSSSATGVQIRASVIGTAIATETIDTNVTTSSNDVAIVVAGTAGSVAFGQATKITDAGGVSTIYSFPMSVIVADANGNPAPLGTVVNLSVWPIAWSTGSGCTVDADTATTGTFYNEDQNQNLILGTTEDGYRRYYATGATVAGGTTDFILTPPNSYGGTVASTNPLDLPGTATTNASGVATFNLTYTKTSAIWIISRIRAQALMQGTPAVGQLDLRLVPSLADTTPLCLLPPSPFNF